MRVRKAVFPAAAAITVLAACSYHPSTPVPDLMPPGLGAPLPAIDQLPHWATSLADTLRMPVPALQAYGFAAATLARDEPGCGIGWTTIAGIGSVESRNGTYDGASVQPNGDVTPHIRGIALDGSPGVADIPDTDGGVMDGDSKHDRAMGPLQFIPETWRQWGTDANGDGVADPDNIDDAALTAARYLCARGGDLRSADGWRSALLAYNMSTRYARQVQERANAYSVGTSRW
ncbi:murein transglycosylase [Skermania sp. ID1734]|uniref:lytic transglycosylase domain-containing protein n=1 Tax=Skermania sp. ID1734 TaxID=2597516 RepID=UPI00117D041D|nr:lytic murein transglycosylase [Skermania sp. ID1734]TSD99780.1 murein transglycosylase [Skermania sp. ID1734]